MRRVPTGGFSHAPPSRRLQAPYLLTNSKAGQLNRADPQKHKGEIVKRIYVVICSALLLAMSFSSNAFAASNKDIVETAVAAGDFKTLSAALQAAGLVDTLKGAGPFTVFAPTDEAFAKLPAGTVEDLLKPENKQKLISILTYHVVPGEVMAKDVVKLHEAKTVNGAEVKIMVDGDKVMVGNSNVTKTDIECSNGVIHVIDTVLLPQ
jgi:uncharacterized surface protein with fasciclin (FAS1) repeats